MTVDQQLILLGIVTTALVGVAGLLTKVWLSLRAERNTVRRERDEATAENMVMRAQIETMRLVLDPGFQQAYKARIERLEAKGAESEELRAEVGMLKERLADAEDAAAKLQFTDEQLRELRARSARNRALLAAAFAPPTPRASESSAFARSSISPSGVVTPLSFLSPMPRPRPDEADAEDHQTDDADE